MKQPEWDITKEIEELTIEHGENLTELIKGGIDLIKKKKKIQEFLEGMNNEY